MFVFFVVKKIKTHFARALDALADAHVHEKIDESQTHSQIEFNRPKVVNTRRLVNAEHVPVKVLFGRRDGLVRSRAAARLIAA